VVEEIDGILKRIRNDHNCTILLVEQNLDFVRDVTKRYAIIDTGRIVAQGDVADLTDNFVRKHLQV
jgi:urea transport system ATP-binding protein